MTLDEISVAMQRGQLIEHNHQDYIAQYTITGVITRYDAKRGWHYSVELKPTNQSTSITIARPEELRIMERK